MRSGVCWFTEFCNSQCLSHFAAPFVDAQAKTSIVESCERFLVTEHRAAAPARQRTNADQPEARRGGRTPHAETGPAAHALCPAPRRARRCKNPSSQTRTSPCVNDPSAGSPTETLLRLLLPLGDKVHSISHNESEQADSSQSKVFTGSPNR